MRAGGGARREGGAVEGAGLAARRRAGRRAEGPIAYPAMITPKSCV